ncbi:hypothetical protein R6Q59_006155 [Mikania micrantha]|uniref:H(+)-exporting diphosphatase n=1 Tax=Mikania micrantha TaxID=192012 RepID=A0A5N6PV80_9ASTR|nr:hypothetical protein E3N88_04530 [Mikania micrantha]
MMMGMVMVVDGGDGRKLNELMDLIVVIVVASVIIPIFAIAVSIFVRFSFAAMFGIAVAALGMLSTIATGLAIDAYGPISDNAGGIAEMADLSHRIRE